MPDDSVHPIVRMFADLQRAELARLRAIEARQPSLKEQAVDETKRDVVRDGRLPAPDVRGEFQRRAAGQEVATPEKDAAGRDAEARTPESPVLKVPPPLVLDPLGGGGMESAAEVRVGSLASSREMADARGLEKEEKSLRETFQHAKLRSLAERRFNAAARERDGRER
jgi:hypothetical protein